MKARGLHEEYNLEDEICAHLGAHGWLYDPTPQASKDYDRERALYVSDLVQWVNDSQPTAWEQLTKTHGAAAEAQLTFASYFLKKVLSLRDGLPRN